MYSSRNSILLIGLTISIILLWCTVQPSYADTNEEEHNLVANTEEDSSAGDEIDDYVDFYRRASLRPVVLHQRASLRPFAGKRASLRPFAGKRASLRPFAGKRASLRPFAGKRASLRPYTGKRASLRPATYMGKRKRRSDIYAD